MALQIVETLAAGRLVDVLDRPAGLQWANKLQATVGEAGLPVNAAYLRVQSVTVGRDGASASVVVYRDSTVQEVLRSQSVDFVHDLESSDNAIRQAYLALRGIYPDAKDV